MFSRSIRQIYEQIVQPIKRLMPSELEYLSMFGLILWKSENCDALLFETQPVLQKAKDEILQFLHNYFVVSIGKSKSFLSYLFNNALHVWRTM